MEDPITKREKQVLSYTANGMSAEEVGEHLGISKRTVEAHLLNSRAKLFARNTINAVAIAMRRGLIIALVGVVIGMSIIGSISSIRPRQFNGDKIARITKSAIRHDTGSERT